MAWVYERYNQDALLPALLTAGAFGQIEYQTRRGRTGTGSQRASKKQMRGNPFQELLERYARR